MKKYIIILAILTSCQNFLNVQPQGKVIPTTDEEFAAIIHTHLNEIEGGGDDNIIGNMEEISRLEGIADNLDANIKSGNLALFAGTEINKRQSDWKDSFEIIRDCNIIIENIANRNSDTARGTLKAAYSIKAICYYNLLRMYCQPWKEGTELDGLPLVETFDIMDMPIRANIVETRDYIESLFMSALEIGSVDKKWVFNDAIINAYLAKLYFWCEDWTKTISICEDIVNKSGYELSPIEEYEKMIQSPYEGLGEVIIRSHINNASELDWYFSYLKGYIGTRPASAKLIKLFANDIGKDIRYDLFFNSKRFNTKMPEAKIRLSEVVLMLSEAYYHKNNPTEALKWLNKLRKNRIIGVADLSIDDLTPLRAENIITKDASGKDLQPLLQAILDERQKELYMEGDRWYELKRNGRPEWWIISNGLKYTTTKHLYTAPIFKGDIDLNPNMKQNPGYEK